MSWTFATVKVRILTVVCVLIFPQLVMKLFMRCARLAVITLSTEAANTLVAASDAMDHALDPMLGAMSEPFSAFNVITPPMDKGAKTLLFYAASLVTLVLQPRSSAQLPKLVASAAAALRISHPPNPGINGSNAQGYFW